MILSEFVRENEGAAMIFPFGVPQTLPPPDWSSDGQGEMSCCQREFFLKYGNDVPNIPLPDIVYCYDCIGFMNPVEAAPWLRVWMCGGLYASDILNNSAECVTLWAQFALEKCLDVGLVTLPVDAIENFVSRACNSADTEPELHARVNAYRQKVEAGEIVAKRPGQVPIIGRWKGYSYTGTDEWLDSLLAQTGFEVKVFETTAEYYDIETVLDIVVFTELDFLMMYDSPLNPKGPKLLYLSWGEVSGYQKPVGSYEYFVINGDRDSELFLRKLNSLLKG